jgi:3-hydroxyisobutyrate dehydrogenase-like beta-hydroxyacid dehydrogenase
MSSPASDTTVGVGVVGLGNMGAAIAGRWVDWPGGLAVYDVRAEAMEQFTAAGARAATDLADLASTASIISVVVLSDAQVRQVVGDLVEKAVVGTVIAIHSTIDVTTAAELAADASGRGVHVIDAPVTGGPMGAASGNLAVMVGGDKAAFDAVKPAFDRFAGLTVHVGPAGAGTRVKLARALLTFVGYAATAEAQRLAEVGGVDLSTLAALVRHSDAITGGPSAVMVRTTTAPIAAADPLRPIFEHTLALGEKDLSLALSLGEMLGVDLPFARLALERLAEGLGVPT